ncbi:MAG: tetratricopeptide repeat protein [Chloroflexi bacterium]|nr:tetratricopeptide repeat protein [Chloroflexota bacterium]
MTNDQGPRTRDHKGLFWDNIIEAGWLTAAIVTPLFFSWYSNRVFEASKVALLRSITLVMLAAWLSKVLEAGNWKLEVGSWRLEVRGWRNPLLLPILLLVATYILTTITSIAPRISFWGSYQRQQGLYVVLCYVVIFFLMLEGLRTRQQLERLITVILLTSLPVSLYGIMQRYEVDPLVWTRGGAERVESTLGNPILIGAYLIMVVPLTVGQLIRSFSPPPFPPTLRLGSGQALGGLRGEEKKIGPSLVPFGCYLLLLTLQLICLVFTQSRGPAMGFMAGALFFFLLLAVLRGRRGLALAAVGISIALLAILAILNLPDSPLTPPKGVPFVERLGEISRDITYDRSLIWQGAVNMLTVDQVRVIIGYGPETMGLIFYRYMLPDWAASKGYEQVADRCHNETLDAWVTGGLIGLAAYLVLFGSIFYYGLRWLGLIANSRQRTFLVVTLLVGGLSGALIPWLVEGSLRWAGVGIPAGMLLALVVYLMTVLFHQNPKSKVQSPKLNFQLPASSFQILLIALLSALIAHFVEIQFGIAITATRAYFWLYAALLTIIGHQWQKEPVTEEAGTPPPDSSRRRRRRPGKAPSAKLKAQSPELLAHSLLVGLILATTSFDLITHRFELRAHGPVIFGLLFATWLFGAMPILISNLQSPISNISRYALGSLFCFLPFLAAHAAIALPGAGVERLVAIYYVYLFLVILAVAGALMIRRQASNVKRETLNVKRRALSFGFCILIFWLILNTNLKAAQADIYYKFALSSEERGEIDKAIALYRQAIQLAPHWDQYYVSLGWAYGLKAATTSDAHQEAALFEESLEALGHAHEMSPLEPDIITKLGHVYWNWGGLTSDPEQRAEKLEVALSYYRQAVTLSPLNHGHLLKDNIVKAHLHLGEIYADLGKLSQAAEAYQKASEVAPDSYESRKGLALVYRQLGRLDEALEEARTARDLAPEEERPGLDDLIAELEAQIAVSTALSQTDNRSPAR